MPDNVDRSIKRRQTVPLKTLDRAASGDSTDQLGRRLYQPSDESRILQEERIELVREFVRSGAHTLTPTERAVVLWHHGMSPGDDREYSIDEIASTMLGVTPAEVKRIYSDALLKLKGPHATRADRKEELGGDMSEFGDL